MSDQKQTPIAREWLQSKGFIQCGLNANRYGIRATSKDEIFVEYDPQAFVFLENHCGETSFGNLTQERLSALWFALTGEEL